MRSEIRREFCRPTLSEAALRRVRAFPQVAIVTASVLVIRDLLGLLQHERRSDLDDRAMAQLSSSSREHHRRFSCVALLFRQCGSANVKPCTPMIWSIADSSHTDMNCSTVTPLRILRLRFDREPERHVIVVSVYGRRRGEWIHLDVEAIYEDGSMIHLKGDQVAAMSAQYEEPALGNRGQVNFGDLKSDRVDIATEKLRGMGLGSAMFCELVATLRELPPVPVATFYLSEEDASDENRERRNQFYERFGISFNFFLDDRYGGESVDMSSSELIAAEPSNHQGWLITKI